MITRPAPTPEARDGARDAFTDCGFPKPVTVSIYCVIDLRKEFCGCPFLSTLIFYSEFGSPFVEASFSVSLPAQQGVRDTGMRHDEGRPPFAHRANGLPNREVNSAPRRRPHHSGRSVRYATSDSR